MCSSDLADPLPDEDNPAALFVGGYLRKGGGAALVAPAGIGKSSFSIQASILWAMGKSAFGIKPVRRLNIVIIQAEDDPEEVAHMRNEVRRGLLADSYDERCIDEAMKKILVYDFTGLVGERFCENKGETALPPACFSSSAPFSSKDVKSLMVGPPKLCRGRKAGRRQCRFTLV